MNHVENLLSLIRDNPTLPVVPMVEYEVVGEEWGRWMGSFGYSEVGEYALYDERYYEDRDDFKEAYYSNNDEELCSQFQYTPRINEFSVSRGMYTQEQLLENEKAEKLLEEYLDRVAEEYFKKAIIVNIDTPNI